MAAASNKNRNDIDYYFSTWKADKASTRQRLPEKQNKQFPGEKLKQES